ncbi:uncharacterized protein Z518_11294 [Rhinocladiella mackenziei CBS 650.93]|uniref:Rhinocladiella mackenziei CBS 650.93 unplaced genomic scaffold supercont1.12, whole genome shotgun sequence n=1 Tax=Rhinocladiella mackenziei CBS 650.93 TaxID=1442369 RepID=A0A0D2I8L9_9EURO|nr:uncharacterized protein Z518_11294 [Rhinocladiella mackenziei CBS 650.93]KIW99555.1 hypothetical protein Z518_11294 [Rhinocladiella mackenziei CBS 650.93]
MLEFRFPQSTPVLRELARLWSPPSPLPSVSSEYTEEVKPFEFIDGSLSLLGDLQRAHDTYLRQELEKMRDFIASKFELKQYENGSGDRAQDQKFTQLMNELQNFKQEVA